MEKRNIHKRFDPNDEREYVIAEWVDKIFNQYIRKVDTEDTPNLFSLSSVAAIKINNAFEETEKRGSSEGKEELKRRVAEKLAKFSSQVDLNRVRGWLDEIKRAYRALGFSVIDLTAKLTYKGLVGAGSGFGHTAFEVGLAFDPILNVPYMPGSGIKGAARAAAELFMNGDRVEMFFGDDSVGRLDFHDAYPVQAGVRGYLLVPDVMTPHYSRGGQDILGEDKAHLTPIPFMAIAPETTFRFLIADRKGNLSDAKEVVRAVAVAFSNGLGAKTSIGYGVFELLNASFETGGKDARR
ncbi:MAG: type III-B CRISPR module RAMP protein Cmr6 [Candidatus Caldarchaeum sp.]|nr:type III-B CRISPR module RAMP protein Cmr6 [Candidatus Caldarchaeum sp.]